MLELPNRMFTVLAADFTVAPVRPKDGRRDRQDMAPSKNLAPRGPGRDFVPHPPETLRFAAKALFHAYGTGPGARRAGPKARSIGMEQRLGRKSKGF